MKEKIILILIIGALILNGLEVGALRSDIKDKNFESHDDLIINPVMPEYSHKILSEFGTTTWCGWCKYAHGALKNLYLGKWHPFFYVTMVVDKNMHAANRIWNDYNCYGYPTVFWDGGQIVNGGAGSIPDAMATYNTTIIECGNRSVPDIDLKLNVSWLGNATMNIEVSVDNNNASIYDGYIRVYVTEVSSTLGWYDTWGYPYTFVFLEYAFDENISIPIYGIWQDSIVWDGHDYYYGIGYDFGNISYGNILVIATVFNSEWHQGYAYPPDGNPFDAYWVDDTTGIRVGNNSLPNVPSDPHPSNGEVNVNTEADLIWTGGDPNQWNPQDIVTYDVYFGTNSSPPKVSSNQSTSTYNPGTLDVNTTFYWQIISRDNHGAHTVGPIWNFITSEVPNRPPDAPTIDGPQRGRPGIDYNYTFVANDPNGDDIWYHIGWGDKEIIYIYGPYPSGEELTLSYNWSGKGNFTISALSRDIYDAESNWSEFEVSIPRIRFTLNSLFLQILEKYLKTFTIIKYLFGIL